MDLILPYKIGDFAESKSFLSGYRGAWFRCKVNNMRVTEAGHLECYLEYIDYPGEKKEWIRVFEKNPAHSKQKSSEEIMMRPSFPQWCGRDQVPEQFPNNDVIATVYETWKVGDLVDWLFEGCYWSGKITKLLDDDMVEVELLKPPKGEGKRYHANHSDLRPTLDWSLIGDWTVPLSQAKGKSWYAARLIHHKSESETSVSGEETASTDDDNGNGCGGGDSDSDDVQQPMRGASNISQDSLGSPVLKPSSTADIISSLNGQKDATLTPMENLKPSSTSQSPDRSHGVQTAVTSSQPGTENSIKQEAGTWSSVKQEQGWSLTEHEADDAPDEYLEKLDEIEGRLKQLLEFSRSERERRVAVLASCRWSYEDVELEEMK